MGGFIGSNDQTQIGVYPATIGYQNLGQNEGRCTAVRISKEYFLTAAGSVKKFV
ncbi:MAG TPA: hypothetical protein VE954_38895 [Oligoflexus sp.]|uniref:hypothetical protein n=1 Tax=Oligoflexus sp. TaxID=1971216 RepID=UPI002D341C3B|nr:hypothetical protein [Oligoflexus sp.]HYX39110.1 hypothetical protein [Oligoflexus sp.]